MKKEIQKVEELLQQTKAPQNQKNIILHLAKRSAEFGYKPCEIIRALEMGIAIQNGAGFSLTSLPGTGYSKGAASFFLEQILPILLTRRSNNYVIKINNQSALTINLN